jgi:hypothetical protein
MYSYADVAAIALCLCQIHTSVLLSKEETSVQDSANHQRGNNISFFFLE